MGNGFTRARWIGAAIAGFTLFGCGSDGNTDTDGASALGGASGTGGSGGASGSPSLTPGPSADGWSGDYGDAAAIGCSMTAADLEGSSAARVAAGEATIYAGYVQASSNNQDPVVARVDRGTVSWCVSHETQGPDGRARGVTWDGGEVAYVVYTVVGGGTDLEAAATDGWLNAYAPGAISGGGPAVSFVGRLDAATGALSAGTFIVAALESGQVNTHQPAAAVTVLGDGSVEFLGDSAHKPIDADGISAMDCTDYPFSSRYVLSSDLSGIVCAECTNCVSQQPCD